MGGGGGGIKIQNTVERYLRKQLCSGCKNGDKVVLLRPRHNQAFQFGQQAGFSGRASTILVSSGNKQASQAAPQPFLSVRATSRLLRPRLNHSCQFGQQAGFSDRASTILVSSNNKQASQAAPQPGFSVRATNGLPRPSRDQVSQFGLQAGFSGRATIKFLSSGNSRLLSRSYKQDLKARLPRRWTD